MQKDHIEILDNVALIAAPLNLFSPERDTGERKTVDLMVNKRSIQFVDTKLLAPFRRKRTELRRMLVALGTRVPLFNAYATPVASIGAATAALNQFKEDWGVLRDDFAAEYPMALEELKLKHPARAMEINRFAPTISELLSQMEFRFTLYKVSGESIQSESGLASEILSLPERVMDDISKELSERAGQGQLFRQGIRGVLARVRAKAEGFGFLHPVIAAIPEAIDKTLAHLPTEGTIQGADGILLGGLIGALQNRRILTEGIVTLSSTAARLEAEALAETPDAPAIVDESVIQEASDLKTGTWDW